ncbi:MAG TPA: WYL domain-containing protein [Actinomycetes bacterium]|nr:WYL domain-containing protein [Actinomycetes bacterium]
MSSNVSRNKTERLLNLTIALLATRRFLSREEIRTMVPGYSERDEAFERAFERDKDDLREMGIPIETGSNSALFDDEPGYRIRRDAYALPEVTFTGDEMAVLAVAAQAWSHAALGAPAASALRKLKAYGVGLDDVVVAGLAPRVETREPAFARLWEAVRDARPVRFGYRRSGADTTEERTVEPWGIVSWRGRWYVVGHDRGREATRVFRLSRVRGEVTLLGRPGQVVPPSDVDLHAAVVAVAAAPARGTAQVRLRRGAGGFLRRRATAVTAADAEWEVLDVPYGDLRQLGEELASLGAAAVALGPAELRAEVCGRLRAAAGLEAAS